MFREQRFSRVFPKKHLYFSIPTTGDNINRVKICGTQGPVCSSHTEPVLRSELRPRPKDLQLSHQAIVSLPLSRKLRPTSPESVSEYFACSYTDYARSKLFGNLKRQERQVAETAPRCHGVTRQAGHQQVIAVPYTLPSGHPSANISPGRG